MVEDVPKSESSYKCRVMIESGDELKLIESNLFKKYICEQYDKSVDGFSYYVQNTRNGDINFIEYLIS